MFLSDDFGIDLGYDTIKIYDAKDDKTYSIRDRAAVRKKGGVIAFGDEAYSRSHGCRKNHDLCIQIR